MTGKEVSSNVKSTLAIAINNSNLSYVKYINMFNLKKNVYVLLKTEFMILLHKRKSGLSLGCVCHEHGAANEDITFMKINTQYTN